MTKTPQHNVPELRFPEFEGEWEEKKLGDIASFSKGKSLSKKDISENGVACILYGELYTKYNAFIDEIYSKTSVDKSTLVQGKENQILIPSSGETSEDIATASCLVSNKVVYIGGDINIITPKKDKGRFISLSLNSVNKNEIAKFAQGKSVVHLYNDHLKKTKIKIPNNLNEQEKIGTFFSKLDRQIELEEEKLELLEQQKKGYMQKIFSQELRFKDENNNSYPEWKIKKLEEISEFQNGKAHENFVSDTGKFILVNSKFISTESKVKKYVDKQLTPLEINDIAIVMSDVPNGKALAKCYLIENDNTFTLNQRIGRIFNIEGNSRFLFTQINRNKQLLKYDSGVGQTNLKKSEIIGIKIYWPNKREQDKIGDFFINLDSIIEKQSTKVELLKERKKGLLQKMFV